MTSDKNKRIFKNTLLLYTRQILILLVGLYTVRIVLNVLGVEDFGIYNVVAGVVSLFSFLSGSMASATQRFFSFAIGQKNTVKLKQTYTVNLVIYAGVALFSLAILEILGSWFIHCKLNIPIERYNSAVFVFHFSVFSFIATIFTSPFIAIIVAHEDMKIFAYASIAEALMKLIIVFILTWFQFDYLKMYSILVFIVSIITSCIYICVCLKKYEECCFHKSLWNYGLLKEILSFTSWTLFGQLSTVVRSQAITILLNQFFNPTIVAGRAIASTISDKINIFSSNFNMGIYPQIIKSYATNDKENLFSLIFNGSKLTFLLMWIFVLPLFLQMETILSIWLKEPPSEALIFTRLALLETLISSLSLPIATAARAPGKMKTYELLLGSIQILIFIVSWILLKMGGAPFIVYVVAIVANLIMFIVRLWLVRLLIGLSIRCFSTHVIIPVLVISIISFVPSFVVYVSLPTGIIYACISVITSIMITSIVFFYFGLNHQWRKAVCNFILSKLQKIILLGR